MRGIHRGPVNSALKGQWRGAFVFSLICTWINDGVNNGEAGDLRRHRAHYDVTVMKLPEQHAIINSRMQCWLMAKCYPWIGLRVRQSIMLPQPMSEWWLRATWGVFIMSNIFPIYFIAHIIYVTRWNDIDGTWVGYVPYMSLQTGFHRFCLQKVLKWTETCRNAIQIVPGVKHTCRSGEFPISPSELIEGILPNGPYLPCVSMAGRALVAGYHRYIRVKWTFFSIPALTAKWLQG